MWKKVRHKLIQVLIKCKEKTFGNENRQLKFLYIKAKGSKNLAVVFSAFPAQNKSACYNMISTLMPVKMNKLYILDDFGYKQRGSYYLGENGDFFIPPLVEELIKKYAFGMKHISCIGSSKGGYAALYFGLKLGVNSIIAGAPQYLLGNYLKDDINHHAILWAIMGNTEEKSVDYLNGLLKNVIYQSSEVHNKEDISITIHYSPEEHTYQEHILYLLKDLKDAGFIVSEDIKSYTNHGDVALHFPDLCVEKFMKLCC